MDPLVVDSSVLTDFGNDYGVEHVFAKQVEDMMTSKDVFLGIIASGKSMIFKDLSTRNRKWESRL